MRSGNSQLSACVKPRRNKATKAKPNAVLIIKNRQRGLHEVQAAKGQNWQIGSPHKKEKKMGREEIGQRPKMLFEGSETHTERQGQEV